MFDFDATLPLMAVQFLILAVLLNALFYKPIGKALDERSDYVRDSRLGAEARLEQAKQLAQQYEQDLADTRRQAQTVLAEAQAEAQKIAATQMGAALQDAQAQREKARREIDEQKAVALTSLEQQVDALSHQLLQKLLGTEVVG